MARTLTERALLALAACALIGVPGVAPAAEVNVTIRDNLFAPQELHVDPGDTVTWIQTGRRVHDVTSDTGEFASGDLPRGTSFTHTFEKEGFYYYHCSFHGRAGQKGMWGVVVVGDPKPPEEPEPTKRPRLDVPADFRTIQAAVDAAEPGSTIVVAPGRYRGEVSITTDDLVVRGVDRFRTVLDGDDVRASGFTVEDAERVTIANLTVRNFLDSGIAFVGAARYTAKGVDAILNRTYGISATRSYDGVVRDSFGWGSGAAAFHVSECMGCGALVDDVRARASYTGFEGRNATGVTVRGSSFVGNGAGIVSATAEGPLAPGRGTLVVGNLVRANDNATIPRPAGGVEPIPIGTGIWLAGVENDVVRGNEVLDHPRYGILVTDRAGAPPVRATIVANRLGGTARFVLAWDGTGPDNCFTGNDFTGVTGPPDIETLYACAARPFAGSPYEPVEEDVAAALADAETRATADPPEPLRPRCQKGRPGCHRH